MGGSEKGCELRFGAIVDKPKISLPKISLTYNIETPYNSPFNTNIVILYYGDNIHFSNIATPITALVKCEHTMEARLPYVITMYSTHVATLLLIGMSRESSKIHIFPEIKTSPLISLGVLCDDGCTITLYKQTMKVQNNRQQILAGYRNKHTRMWEAPFTTTQNK